MLARGEASPSAPWFDIDWSPPEAGLRGRVLLPVPADHYGRELEAGTVGLEREGGWLVVRYAEHCAPLDPVTTGELLAETASAASDATLGFAAQAMTALTGDADVEHAREMAAGRLATDPDAAAALDGLLSTITADPDRLDAILCRQHHRLARWATADAGLVVEKICARGEPLPADWPVDGTTGYEVAAAVTGLQLHPDGRRKLVAAWQEHTGHSATFRRFASRPGARSPSDRCARTSSGSWPRWCTSATATDAGGTSLVPDTYQGTETWDLSLVDPDNRRPVDLAALAAMRRRLGTTSPAALWADPSGRAAGTPSTRWSRRGSRCVGRSPDCSTPAWATSRSAPRRTPVVAFTRAGAVLVAFPRFTVAAGTGAGRVDVPKGRWTNVCRGTLLEGGPQPLATLRGNFPVVVLVRDVPGAN